MTVYSIEKICVKCGRFFRCMKGSEADRQGLCSVCKAIEMSNREDPRSKSERNLPLLSSSGENIVGVACPSYWSGNCQKNKFTVKSSGKSERKCVESLSSFGSKRKEDSDAD